MSTPTVIPTWTPVIIKGGVFTLPITFTTETGVPLDYTNLEIFITPNGAADFSWSVGTGQIVQNGTGDYTLTVGAVETASYTWTSGTYRMSLTDNIGNPVPCIIEGQ